MTRPLEKQGMLHFLVIFLVILVRGENHDAEAISACSAPQNVTLGGSAQIIFTFNGDLRNNAIVVYKRDSGVLVKVADCFFRPGERLCDSRPGFNFNLTSDKEHTRGVLIIERVTEQFAGEYVCQTLNPPKLCLPCVLQVSKEKPEVITQMVFREEGHSPDKKIDAAQNQTGTDRNSTLPPGAIAGIVVTVVALIGVAVAAVVVMKYKRTCCKTAYIPTTFEGGVTSSDKRDQTLCISPITKDGNTLSAYRLESRTPLMKDKLNV